LSVLYRLIVDKLSKCDVFLIIIVIYIYIRAFYKRLQSANFGDDVLP